MSDSEINIAIAEACGWVQGKHFEQILPTGEGETLNVWINPKTEEWEFDPPNYCADLNAMHEVWNTLDRKQRIAFSRILREVVVNAGGHASSFNEDIVACVENATARQRAEAFLRVLGKWKEPAP